MVADQFPMFKLATLVARQLAAPVAQRIKTYASSHPMFSRMICMRVARLYYEAELRFKLWSLRVRLGSKGNAFHFPPLSDQDALTRGSDILGEAVIFAIGAAILTFEINRQAAKTEAKVAQEMSGWVAVLIALEELQKELSLQQEEIDRLRGNLAELVDPSQYPVLSKSDVNVSMTSPNHES